MNQLGMKVIVTIKGKNPYEIPYYNVSSVEYYLDNDNIPRLSLWSDIHKDQAHLAISVIEGFDVYPEQVIHAHFEGESYPEE